MLIDESHVTAHCYSEQGWLAIDVFTCGSHSPHGIARSLIARLLDAVPGLKLRSHYDVPRFLGHERKEWIEDGDARPLPLPPPLATPQLAGGGSGDDEEGRRRAEGEEGSRGARVAGPGAPQEEEQGQKPTATAVRVPEPGVPQRPYSRSKARQRSRQVVSTE